MPRPVLIGAAIALSITITSVASSAQEGDVLVMRTRIAKPMPVTGGGDAPAPMPTPAPDPVETPPPPPPPECGTLRSGSLFYGSGDFEIARYSRKTGTEAQRAAQADADCKANAGSIVGCSYNDRRLQDHGVLYGYTGAGTGPAPYNGLYTESPPYQYGAICR